MKNKTLSSFFNNKQVMKMNCKDDFKLNLRKRGQASCWRQKEEWVFNDFRAHRFNNVTISNNIL